MRPLTIRLAFLSTAALFFSMTAIAKPSNPQRIDAEVKKITKSAILIDTHNDIPSFTVDGADIGNSPKNHTDIPRLRQGGLGAVFFSVYVAATYVNGNHSANRTR
jgi:membrane dipeptidase